MTKEDLIKYKEKLGKLSEKEEKLRNIYLSKLSKGELYGPITGYPSIDKPQYAFYDEASILFDVPDVSMLELIEKKNKDKLSNIAIEYYGTTYTYDQMFKEIKKLALKYKKLGIKQGDVVAICMPTTPEAIFSLYALNKLGVICDMIDPRSNANQLQYYLKEDQAKSIILCENYYSTLKNSLTGMENVILTPINVSGKLKFKSIVGLKTKIDNIKVKKDDNVIT